jgi:AcrR family transcriptional regulator
MPRPKVHDAALRARLLDRAAQMLSAGGPAGVSLRMLARDCGTSTTAVYSLFGGKSELLAALLDEAARRFGAALSAVRPDVDPVAGLVWLATAYRNAALADPHVFDALFGERPDAAGNVVLTRMRELVERAITEKALPPGLDPAAAARTLWATVHGWVVLQRGGLLPAETGVEDALRGLLDGWSAQYA